MTNFAKTVPFDVVELWYNDTYTPYTTTPAHLNSQKCYAILVDGKYFLLGSAEDSLYVMDIE